MNAIEIKSALRAKGFTLADMARRLKVTRPHVSKVIDGYNTSRRVKRGIARVLRLPEAQVWALWQRREYPIIPFIVPPKGKP